MLATNLVACRAKRPTFETESLSSKRLEIIDRKTDVNLKGGESQAAYLIVSDGEAIKKLTSTSNDIAGEPEVSIDTNGILRVKCPCLDRTEQVTVSDTKQTETDKTVKQKTVYIIEPSRWQWIQIYVGRISVGIIGIVLLVVLLKNIIKHGLPNL